MALRLYGLQSLSRNFCLIGCRMMGNDLGGGAGKGGGTGGTIREAGGTFGKIEAAREEEYIRRLQKQQLKELRRHLSVEINILEKEVRSHQNAQQLKALKDHLDEEVNHHERIIKEHQEAIKRHKQKISELAGKSDTD